jgi:DNA-binding transcriptional MocR family regulator
METIQLARGLPPLSVMEHLKEPLIDAYKEGMRERTKDMLQYGHFMGYEPLRDRQAEKFGVDKERVVIGNGSMDTLNHYLLWLKGMGKLDHVVAGEEVYDRPLGTATQALELQKHGIPMTEEGLDVLSLEQVLLELEGGVVVYVVEDWDNPSGIHHSPSNRKEVEEVVRKHGCILVRDGAYSDLGYLERSAPQPVPENVIQTFSWSKVISAGHHTGGIIIPSSDADSFKKHVSDWRLSPVLPTQVQADILLGNGTIDRHLESVVLPDGENRVTRFNELMKNHLPESQRHQITGGHFWGGHIKGLHTENWDTFKDVALEEHHLAIPDAKGFKPFSSRDNWAGYVRIPLFIEQAGVEEPLRRIVVGIRAARDAVIGVHG